MAPSFSDWHYTARPWLEGKAPHIYETLEHVTALSTSSASWRKKDLHCPNMKVYTALLVLFSVYFSSVSPLISLCLALKTRLLIFIVVFFSFPISFQFQVASTVNGKIWLMDDVKDFYSQLFFFTF